MITGTAHVAVTAKDMEESIRFYTEALGFRKAFTFQHPDTGAPWIVYMNITRGQFLELFYGGEEDCPWHDRLIGFNHLCFEVDDITSSVQQVRDAGYSIDVEPQQGVDRNWQAWTRDPNGVRIELMQIMPESPQYSYR